MGIKEWFARPKTFVTPLANRINERRKRIPKDVGPALDRCPGLKRCVSQMCLDCKIATMMLVQVILMGSAILLFLLSVTQLYPVQRLPSGLNIEIYPQSIPIRYNNTNDRFVNGTLSLPQPCFQIETLYNNRPLKFRLAGTNDPYFMCPWLPKNNIMRIATTLFAIILNPISMMMALRGHKFQTFMTIGGKAAIFVVLFINMGLDAKELAASKEWCEAGAPGLNFVDRNGAALECDYSPFIATVFFDMTFLLWAIDIGLTAMYITKWVNGLDTRDFERMQNEEL
eukprot:TRINITY_DN655_c0_g1_i1.p1 TRINITY_DN655_c0_g1~~TRINITY_DN655_c0_g1_i1.p1  ORF type:complete len:284 (-),score=41.78 TRINITY_DN655_c0_g1_i1:45-896(-)